MSYRSLGDEDHAEPDIVVAIAGIVVVAVRGPAVPGIVVPGTAAQHAVRTFDRRPSATRIKYTSPEGARIRMCGKGDKRKYMALIHLLTPLPRKKKFFI